MKPAYLNLPAHGEKPRTLGRSCFLDKGHGLGFLEDHFSAFGEYIDLLKLGWGTSVISPVLDGKIELCRRFEVDLCFGGTLFEISYRQEKLDDYLAWMRDLGLRMMEISDGTISIDHSAKLQFIERFAKHFTVLSEVGSKDTEVVVSPAKWARAIKEEVEAGASQVILEGRESGTVGLYRGSGEIRMGLVEDILDTGIPLEKLVFEAPLKSQQAWLIKRIGPEVNLANIPLSEALALETLRLGLRSDTLEHFHPAQDREG